jgi:hypothetical protein
MLFQVAWRGEVDFQVEADSTNLRTLRLSKGILLVWLRLYQGLEGMNALDRIVTSFRQQTAPHIRQSAMHDPNEYWLATRSVGKLCLFFARKLRIYLPHCQRARLEWSGGGFTTAMPKYGENLSVKQWSKLEDFVSLQ